MKWRVPVFSLVVLGILGGGLAILMGIKSMRQNRLVNVGEEIRYDDFGFTVAKVTKTGAVGSKERLVRAYGTFWVLDLEIKNHARRVSYRMDSHVPWLVDEAGREIPVSGRGQSALDAQLFPEEGNDTLKPTSLGPGDSLVSTLVFDVPDDAGDVRLKLVFGGTIGEMLDFVFLGRRRFALN
ncbi:MAG: DUF4352 domain-containing protein [Planctomycetota bacterium]